MNNDLLEQFSKGLTLGQPNDNVEEGPAMHINYGNGILLVSNAHHFNSTEHFSYVCKKFGHTVFCSVANIYLSGGIKRIGGVLFKNNTDAVRAAEYLCATSAVTLVNGSSPPNLQAYSLTLLSLLFQFYNYDLIDARHFDKPRLTKILRYFEEFLYLYAT